LTVQESLKRDPHAGDLYIFRGRRGDLAKILWHDGIGLSLYCIVPVTAASAFVFQID
jgi:transposase